MTSYDVCPSCGTVTDVTAPPHPACRSIRGPRPPEPLHPATRFAVLVACLLGTLVGLAGWILLDGNVWATVSVLVLLISASVAVWALER